MLDRPTHDFYCKKSADMHYPKLAEQVRYYKETEEGQNMMSIEAQQLMRKVEERGEKRGEKRGAHAEKKSIAKKLLIQGLTHEQISAATDLPLDEIKKIDAERR